MQQIIQFYHEAPAAAIFVAASIVTVAYLGIRLFVSGLVKHFVNYGKN